MTENIEKILDIKVKYSEAVEGIAKLNQSISQLKTREKELKQAFEEGNITKAQMRKEIAAGVVVMNQEKEALRTLTKEVQNNLRQEQQKEGSLKSLRAELSNLTKQYDELSRAERQGAKGDELRQKLNAVTTELKKAEEETQRYYRNVGNYENALKPMRAELKEMVMQLAQMEREGLRGSEAYNELAAKAGKLKDNISDANAAVKRMANDTRVMTDVTNLVQTATTAWQVYQGALNAFGLESETAMKAMQKLQGIMAITNGLQRLNKQLTDNSTATYKAYHAVLKALGIEKQKDIVTTNAETAAQQAITKAMTASASAARILRVALATLGIGALITIIATLVSYSDEISHFFGGMTDAEKKAAKQQEELNEVMRESREQVTKNIAEIVLLKMQVDNFNGSQKEESKLVEELNSKLGTSLGTHKNLAQWKDVLMKKGAALAEVMILESQAQALLTKYTEDYINVVAAERVMKAMNVTPEMARQYAEYGSGVLGVLANAYKNSADRAEQWLKEYTKIQGRINEITNKFGLNAGAATTNKKSTTKTTKATDTAKQEADEMRKAQDLLNKTLADGIEKERKIINTNYENQIADVQKKLKEKGKMTAETEKALNAQIVSLNKLRNQELKKLEEKYVTEEINKRKELIEQRLELAKEGSDAELGLRLQLLHTQFEAEMNAIDQNTNTEEEKMQQRNISLMQYLMSRNQLVEDYNKQLAEKQQQIIQNEFSQRLLDAYSNELEQLRIKLEQAQYLRDTAQQQEEESLESFNARKIELERNYLDAKAALAVKEREIEQAKYDFAAGIAKGLGSVFEALGDENTAFAKMSKILALAEVAINTGKAIAAGVAQAQAVPFPANLAAIATTVTTILTNMATAIKTIKSAKFARGGLVLGEGTGTSDSITARVSNGESVITANATSMFSPLLSAINQLGGGIPIVASSPSQQMGEDMLAAAVAKGMSYAPSPVVSVQEITNVSNRVKAIESLASL